MALCKFPLWERCLQSLAKKVDELYLRFDGLNGDVDIYNNIGKVCGNKLRKIYVSYNKWNAWSWREEMIRMLDNVRPEMVLSHDEDEAVENIAADLKRFSRSHLNQMAFEYKFPMPSEDGLPIPSPISGLPIDKPFPSHPHVMVIKWRPGLTFHPYMSRNRVTQYGKNYLFGKAKILHYCYYTEELREIKAETASHKGKLRFARNE